MQKLTKERGKNPGILFPVSMYCFEAHVFFKPEFRHLNPCLVDLIKWPILKERAPETVLDRTGLKRAPYCSE